MNIKCFYLVSIFLICSLVGKAQAIEGMVFDPPSTKTVPSGQVQSATLINLASSVNASKQVTLTWQKASGRSTKFYLIQRSSDGANYSQISQIWITSGNSQTSFSYVDTTTTATNNYQYRIVEYEANSTMYMYAPILVSVI